MPNWFSGWIKRIGSGFGHFVAHRDQRMAYGNLVAVLVGSNQPLFPLTLYVVLGEAARPSLWGMVSTLVFCVVPMVARSHVLAAKLLLSLYASLHTAGYVMVMGQGAGFELFFLPCILLSALLFPARQRLLGWALCAVRQSLRGRGTVLTLADQCHQRSLPDCDDGYACACAQRSVSIKTHS